MKGNVQKHHVVLRFWLAQSVHCKGVQSLQLSYYKLVCKCCQHDREKHLLLLIVTKTVHANYAT